MATIVPVAIARPRCLLQLVLILQLFLLSISAYEVPILDTDYSRQICSGMWAGQSTLIKVSFDATSQGHIAMVIYEWADVRYLGKSTGEFLPRTYICTTQAVEEKTCSRAQLGHFILDLPGGKLVNQTSFWSERISFSSNQSSNKRIRESSTRQTESNEPNNVYTYTQPIQYPVTKTGYYCVAAVPVTEIALTAPANTDVPYHPSYKGLVVFKNTFDGKLPAADYPKVNFYFIMSLVYSAFAAAWAWLCYRHLHELLPIQHYLSGLTCLLVIEMVADWAYYRYLNSHGKSTSTTVFLIVVAILDAARNAMSFFMLLVVSLGLSVVRESLGRTLLKCQLLAGAHFIFGILYAVGIVELELESTSALVLLMFVIPLAFTLSGFLLWIMYSLNATIAQLRARKQRYKLGMFQRLHYILLATVVVIAVFFVVSSLSFSGRLAEDYAAKSWRVRWWLLDGWLALLYLVAFTAIAFLWRPLAMSDEIAQDEEDAEDYDLEAIASRTRERDDDDNATLVAGREGGRVAHAEDVVFEIGDEPASDDEDDTTPKNSRLSGERHRERQGLIGGRTRDG